MLKEIANIKEINFDYIEEYVQEKGEKDKQWLVDLWETEVPPDKNGKKRHISFIEIRNAFVDKYMPELKPKAKPKAPTMQDRIAKLKAKL